MVAVYSQFTYSNHRSTVWRPHRQREHVRQVHSCEERIYHLL